MRVVSLVPSITETLFNLGLTPDEIVGRTKFCIHPQPLVDRIPKMGGTKNPNIQKIIESKPDLIIFNKEENRREDAEDLKSHVEILVTDVFDFPSNVDFLTDLGTRLNRQDEAEKWVRAIHQHKPTTPCRKIPAAYLIWKNPWMTVGGDTYISSQMQLAGFENIFQNQQRYPAISSEALAPAEIIFLSSEPYPFRQEDVLGMRSLFPEKAVELVDGEMFSWFGTRAVKSFTYLKRLRESFEL